MAGRKKRTLDIELAARLHKWRIDSGLAYSSVAERLGVAASTLTRSLELKSFSSEMRERVLMLLDESGDAIGGTKAGQSLTDGISARDLRFLQNFVNHILPKVEEVLKSALRRPSGGEKS